MYRPTVEGASSEGWERWNKIGSYVYSSTIFVNVPQKTNVIVRFTELTMKKTEVCSRAQVESATSDSPRLQNTGTVSKATRGLPCQTPV